MRIPLGVRTIIIVPRRSDRSIPPRAGRLWVAVATLTASAALLGACGAKGESAAAPAVPVPVTQALSPGEAQFQKSCARCHGNAMEGRNGTPGMDPTRISGMSDQMLQMAIQYGKGKMPAFGGLTIDQVNNVIAFLRTL